MGDQDDRRAVVAQSAQHRPQLAHLGRGKHRRRLVENEDLCSAEQHL